MWTSFISLKYFLAKRKEGMISLIGGISVLGVALGVVALIVVISVMNGFDAEVREKIIGTYAHLVVQKEGGIDDHPALISRIESMPEVKSAAGFVTGQAVLRAKGSVTGILLKGIDTEKESKVTEVIRYTGEEATRLKGDTIILGSELMKNERISVGDTVEVVVGYSLTDLEKSGLKVIGSFTSGRYDYDAHMAVVGLPTARKLFRTGQKITGIGLRLENAMKVSGIKSRLESMLKYPYVVRSWMDMDRNLVSALALEKKMMFILLALVIMVACFNIAGSLMMMVMEKTRDIGILRAIGANSRGISLVFLLQGAMTGLAGVMLGGFGGVFLARRVNAAADFIERITGFSVFPNDVYYFTEIPVKVTAPDVGTIIAVAMFLALAAGLYPAWKASRLDPVEAIRYE